MGVGEMEVHCFSHQSTVSVGELYYSYTSIENIYFPKVQCIFYFGPKKIEMNTCSPICQSYFQHDKLFYITDNLVHVRRVNKRFMLVKAVAVHSRNHAT
jgi:hypothetical protein